MGRPRNTFEGPLTPAEIRVLEMLAGGSSPKEIAYDFGLDRTSIHYHFKNLKTRYQARHVWALARIASRMDFDALRDEAKAQRNAKAEAAAMREKRKREARLAALRAPATTPVDEEDDIL